MNILPFVPTIIGAVGSLFKRKGQGQAVNAAQSQQQQQWNHLNQLGQQYGGDAAYYGGQARAYDRQLGQATGQALNTLRQNPYDQAGQAGWVARSWEPASHAFDAAQANLNAQLGARGLGQSSVAAGGATALEGMRAGTLAGLQSQALSKRYETQKMNQLQAQQLLGALTGRYQGLLSGARQGGAAIYGTGLGYGTQQLADARQQDNKGSSDLFNMISQLGSLYLQSQGQTGGAGYPGYPV